MTRPRSALISLAGTPYYHCMARCVRRSFFFGIDEKGRELNYRKPWFLKRLRRLGRVFAINVPGYAVMSNHYHILHIDKARSDSWSVQEVIRRWLQLYRRPELVQRFVRGDNLTAEELDVVQALAEMGERDSIQSLLGNIEYGDHFLAIEPDPVKANCLQELVDSAEDIPPNAVKERLGGDEILKLLMPNYAP